MKEVDYYILDVFAKQKYGGNQLAVYVDLLDKLDDDQMLNIAKEINFAESTFIKKQYSANQFEVRIFTTESEIPFAGHPTIGTAYIIAKYLMTKSSKQIILKLKPGDIKVEISKPLEIENSLFTMTQAQPTFLKQFSQAEISTALGIDEPNIGAGVIQEVTTGLPFIICPMVNLAAINNIVLNPLVLKDFLIKNEIYKTNNASQLSTSFLFYTKETFESENDFNVRMFCIEDDVLKEDAATGSANGCFLAYLLKYKSPNIKVVVEQGFQVGRKSYLYLIGKKEGLNYDLKIGGYSKLVSKGKWFV